MCTAVTTRLKHTHATISNYSFTFKNRILCLLFEQLNFLQLQSNAAHVQEMHKMNMNLKKNLVVKKKEEKTKGKLMHFKSFPKYHTGLSSLRQPGQWNCSDSQRSNIFKELAQYDGIASILMLQIAWWCQYGINDVPFMMMSDVQWRGLAVDWTSKGYFSEMVDTSTCTRSLTFIIWFHTV